MAKIGRNDPCPCGSGKKYKKCCRHKPQPAPPSHGGLPFEYAVGDDDLDELSNRANDLIRARRWGEAEAVIAELADRYPDQIDCIDRKAELLEARGDAVEAAKYYRKAAAFAREHDGFEPASVAWYDEQADKLDPAK